MTGEDPHYPARTAAPRFGLCMLDDGRAPFCGLVLLDHEPLEALAVQRVLPHTSRDAAASIDGLLARWDEAEPALVELARSFAADRGSLPAGAVRRLAGLRVCPPLRPRQILQAGANYRAHVVDLMVAQKTLWPPGMPEAEFRASAEKLIMARREQAPAYVFAGLPSAITGPYDDVVLPRSGKEPDWELELAVVIGRLTYCVARQHAYHHVAGYTIANDLTLRDRVYRPDLPAIGTDWLWAKNAPTFLPLGPYFVPACAVRDPMDLRITLRLNGEPMQDERTSDMLYDIPALLEHTSRAVRLGPGDLLLTGSPAGNGAHRGRFLREGDVIEGEIEGLGAQRNRCTQEPSAGA